MNKKWNSIYVEASNNSHEIKNDTLEKFIYENYFGYTKIDENNTEEYQLHHPDWKINSVLDTKIDFMYFTIINL